MKRVEREEAARALGVGGLETPDQGARRRALANLAREAALRWGPCPRAELLQLSREVQGALDVAPVADMRGVLDDLVALGELIQLRRGEGRRVLVAPSPACALRFATGAAVFGIGGLGAAPDAPAQLEEGWQRPSVAELVRWLPEAPEHIPAVSLASWIGPPDLEGLAPDLDTAVDVLSPDAVSRLLRATWTHQEQLCRDDGAPPGRDAELAVFAGSPGERCGSPERPARGTRWRAPSDAPPGCWPGALIRELGNRITDPVLVQVEDRTATRVHRLPSTPGCTPWDNLWWCAIARGVATSAPERLWREGKAGGAHVGLPRHLAIALDALCEGRRGWTRRFRSEAVAEAVLRTVAGLGGLALA